MRILLLGASIVVLSSTTGMAQTIHWRGAAQINTVTSACAPDWAAGEFFTARYRHPNIGGNGNSTGLSLFRDFIAWHYAVPGLGSTTPQTASGGMLGGKPDVLNGSPTMAIDQRTPAIVGATTPVVTVIGRINNFGNLVGCNIKFTATMSRKT